MLRLNAHAMGACRSRIYTNSLEAFKESLSHGFRDFEVDVNLTRDNKFVVSHDRKRLKDQSYAEFMADRCVGIHGQGAGFFITGGTPLDLEGVFLLLKEHEDVHMMFDFQPAALDLEADNLLRRFCEQFTDESIVGRCMIEVFNERQVDMVKALYNLMPILWIGPSTWGTSLEIIDRYNLSAVSIDRFLVDVSRINLLHMHGVVVYSPGWDSYRDYFRARRVGLDFITTHYTIAYRTWFYFLRVALYFFALCLSFGKRRKFYCRQFKRVWME